MLAYTYIEKGKFELIEKPKPCLQDAKDAIVRVTLGSICTSDLHIKHGSVPKAVPGITVGHEMVGVVEAVGAEVTRVKPGDRVTVNVETFCGECFFCKNGWVNNCTNPAGGWALGCRIDGGQAEYVRVPFADQGLDRIPDSVTDLQALLVGDVLATGYWAAQISEIKPEDTVLVIGAGPTGLCTLQCVLLMQPKRVIICDVLPERLEFVKKHYPQVEAVPAEAVLDYVMKNSEHGGADVVLEAAGSEQSFQLAWQCARPNAIVTIVALYDQPQILPLPEMYGKNLTFKTGGVDGCHCAETLKLIEEGRLDTVPLITHTYSLNEIDKAYELFENRRDGVIKAAIEISAIDTGKLDEYAERAKQQWGKTAEYQECAEKSKNWTKEDEKNISENFMQLFVEFGKLKETDPGSEEVQNQVKKLQDYISRHFYQCSNEILACLGQMYAGDGEFTENINNAGGEGTAEFTAEAIRIYCGK